MDESWWSGVLAGPGGDLRADCSDERYVLLPQANDPRVVVDRASPLAMRDAFERFVTARTRSRSVRTLVGGASSLITRRKGSWAVAASADGATLRLHLSEILGKDVRLSIAVGPPRPNRKPVIRCYTEDELIAVAKLGPDLHTAPMVVNEARWLDAMAAKPLSGVLTPPLLHVGRYGGSELLVMGALDLESDLGVDFAEVPLAVAREFSDRYVDNERMLDTHWWHDVRRRVDHPLLASVTAQMFQTQDHPLFGDLRVSAWHGDWSPWNMGMTSNGKLCIWDWERATIGVPVGFDVLHLHHQYGSGLDDADGDLEQLGVPREQHRLLKCLYLFEICARHAEAGVLDSERHATVIGVLDALTGSDMR